MLYCLRGMKPIVTKLVVVVSMQLLLDALSTTRQFVQGVEASALVKAVRTPDSAVMFVCLAVTTCLCLSLYSSEDVTYYAHPLYSTASLAGIQVI